MRPAAGVDYGDAALGWVEFVEFDEAFVLQGGYVHGCVDAFINAIELVGASLYECAVDVCVAAGLFAYDLFKCADGGGDFLAFLLGGFGFAAEWFFDLFPFLFGKFDGVDILAAIAAAVLDCVF